MKYHQITAIIFYFIETAMELIKYHYMYNILVKIVELLISQF